MFSKKTETKPRTKKGLQNKGVNFYVSEELKNDTIEALENESRTLSEFLRSTMYEKVKEYKKTKKNL